MCGIIGAYGGLDPEIGGRMLDRLVHRGPDDEGTVVVRRELARPPAALDRGR